MKTVKRILSLLIIFAMISTLFVCSPVYADSENVALYGVAFDDGTDSYYPDDPLIYLEGLNDGDPTTSWQYATAGEEGDILSWPEGISAGVMLDAVYIINQVNILVEYPSRYAATVDSIIVEYSTDNVTWNEVPRASYLFNNASDTTDFVYDAITFDPVEAMAVRIVIYQGTSKWCPKIAELEVYSAPEGVTPTDWEPNPNNIAVLGDAFDDGSDAYYTEDGLVSLDGLNDGDYMTCWQYATVGDVESEEILYWPDGIYAGVILSEPSEISQVAILIEDGARYDTDESDMVLEYTPDFANWYEVPSADYSYFNESGISGWSYDIITFDTVEAAAVRVVMYEANSKWSPKIAEFEVYESAELTVPAPALPFTLTDESTYIIDEEYWIVSGIEEGTTVGEFKTNFKEDIRLTDINGNIYSDEDLVVSDAWIMVLVDNEYVDTFYTTLVGDDIQPTFPEISLTDESQYSLSPDLYVFGVTAETTVGEFLSNFNEDIRVTDENGNVLSNDKLVGTGTWIEVLFDGEYINTLYEVVVLGDVSGDGKVNSTDFMQIRKHFLNTYYIDSFAKQFAADVSGDENINSVDFMRVRKHFLGTFDLYS